MSGAGWTAVIVIVLAVAAPGTPRAAEEPAAPPAERGGQPVGMSVAVVETDTTVRLRVRLPEAIDADSIEVVLAGRELTVRARDLGGREIRSQTLRLREPAVEEGAQADYEADGWLTITLQKRHGRGPAE